jgi:hypothetical protein
MLKVFSLVAVLLFLVGSLGLRSSSPLEAQSAKASPATKCTADVTTTQDCHLSKQGNEKITWVAPTSQDLHVCFKEPFKNMEIIVKAGKTRVDTPHAATPNGTYDYEATTGACSGRSPNTPRTNAKIIIED